MKILLQAFLLLALTTISSEINAQNKIALDDRANILTSDAEAILKGRLEDENLELTSSVDFRNRCDYWFGTTYVDEEQVFISIKDCNDKITGVKNLGSRIFTANDQEKALLMYFAISEIISEPGKFVPEEKTPVVQPAYTPAYFTEPRELDPGEHKTRYFFAPSSNNLEEGDLYYNTIYFFVHDVQYGLTDRFSIGMGTTIFGFPFYLTPKVTIPVNEKSAFAIGDMMIIGTWGTRFFGNLLYSTYTRGDARNNITLGTGYLYTNEGDVTGKTNSLVFNFSALGRASDHIYFITENYASRLTLNKTAWFETYDPNTGYYDYRDVQFDQRLFFIYGQAGFRLINRSKDVVSWQIGLSYIFRAFGEVPPLYRPFAESGSKILAFPMIGYARKFGKKF